MSWTNTAIPTPPVATSASTKGAEVDSVRASELRIRDIGLTSPKIAATARNMVGQMTSPSSVEPQWVRS